ncbi:T-cell activation Rho GTPase-activating protein-like, partial [Heliangelus exortis]|uniref:T-cell activation Rho GTPase-activating protein-like n=1 Tax=Heliangelus exortis TaxID=472823 RepID=UPI003A91311D
GTSAAAEAPKGPWGSGSSAALFGQPLAALCSQDGTLPQPIQDLLALLHQQGPSTKGIFRLAAEKRACRQLRKALESGAEVPLGSHPVHLLAAILKDFLREIPSKLLEEELYEEWMRALQETSRQEGLAALKEVASKLPEANLQLLRSLLALLGAISSNADTTSMTAGNLAICLGPSLLSPPQEQTLPLDELLQVTGKVIHLVEFLIDHHRELFEEEAAAPEAEGETSEVCEVHKQHDRKSLHPQQVGLLPQGQARTSSSLQLCTSAG